jgi:site-specific DNA-methyltransferase (adenine-specific)
LAFGGTRTAHRLACAIEDAGFEIRDSIAWLYGSGFPKSLDVSKAIDKAAGAEREVVGRRENYSYGYQKSGKRWDLSEGDITAPATDAAKQWAGYGTALKPSHEPIIVARKPLQGSVASNVLKHGTGGLNIDACRVRTTEALQGSTVRDDIRGGAYGSGHKPNPGDIEAYTQHSGGRWPPNVALDRETADELDKRSGYTRDGVAVNRNRDQRKPSTVNYANHDGIDHGYGGFGGASRFFPVFETPPAGARYAASCGDCGGDNFFSTQEARQAWLREHNPKHIDTVSFFRCHDQAGFPTFRYTAKAATAERPSADGVSHPTVKPLELMRWLVRLVTPPGGTVLDPFAGTGTTGEAAIHEHKHAVLIEREPSYLPLIVARLSKPMHVGFNFDEEPA